MQKADAFIIFVPISERNSLMTYLRPVLFLLLLAAQLPLRAQGQLPLRLSFNRQNTTTYTTALDWVDTLRIGTRYRLLANIHHDNILNTAAADNNKFVQLYVRSNIFQYYRINKKTEAVTWFESDQYFNAKNQRASAYAGVRYTPYDWLEITPMAGYSWDLRSARLDRGFSPAVQLRAEQDWGDGLQMQTTIFARTKYLAPRHQRNIMAKSDWRRTFGENAEIYGGVQAGSNEMDDYKRNSVEKIKADTLLPSLGVRYQVGRRIRITSENALLLTTRRFDYERVGEGAAEFNDFSFTQQNMSTKEEIIFNSKKLTQKIAYSFDNTIRRYAIENDLGASAALFERLRQREKQKDFSQKIHLIDIQTQIKLNRRQRLLLSANNRYVQYDTPSRENFDDHDELGYMAAAEWQADWHSRFSTRYKLIGNVRKYAFLFKERSQDNYTQRILRLEFDYTWLIFSGFRLRGEQFLYVTYNVKDFADLNFTNLSTRNLESRLVAQWQHTPRVRTEISLYRKEIQSSYLNWQAFSETALDTTVMYIGEAKTAVQLRRDTADWFLDVGYKHFQQLRFQNTSMIDNQGFLRPINLHIRNAQTGFVTGIRYQSGNNTLKLNVWWQIQSLDYKFLAIPAITSLAATYQERDLRQKTVAFRPFVGMELAMRL